MEKEPISNIAKALARPTGREAAALLAQHGPQATVSDAAWERVEARAAQYMAADKTLSKPRAIMRVTETDEGRELYEIMRRYSRQTIGDALDEARKVEKRKAGPHGFATWGEAVDGLAKAYAARDNIDYTAALEVVRAEVPIVFGEWLRELRGGK